MLLMFTTIPNIGNMCSTPIRKTKMAKNTSISLGPHFDKFIEKQLKSGRYSTASEVVRESLRLLEEQQKNKAALRKALVAGEKSGITGPINLDKIKQDGRAALKSKRKSA